MIELEECICRGRNKHCEICDGYGTVEKGKSVRSGQQWLPEDTPGRKRGSPPEEFGLPARTPRPQKSDVILMEVSGRRRVMFEKLSISEKEFLAFCAVWINCPRRPNSKVEACILSYLLLVNCLLRLIDAQTRVQLSIACLPEMDLATEILSAFETKSPLLETSKQYTIPDWVFVFGPFSYSFGVMVAIATSQSGCRQLVRQWIGHIKGYQRW